jgi:hypothetical protein
MLRGLGVYIGIIGRDVGVYIGNTMGRDVGVYKNNIF